MGKLPFKDSWNCRGKLMCRQLLGDMGLFVYLVQKRGKNIQGASKKKENCSHAWEDMAAYGRNTQLKHRSKGLNSPGSGWVNVAFRTMASPLIHLLTFPCPPSPTSDFKFTLPRALLIPWHFDQLPGHAVQEPHPMPFLTLSFKLIPA